MRFTSPVVRQHSHKTKTPNAIFHDQVYQDSKHNAEDYQEGRPASLRRLAAASVSMHHEGRQNGI